jgi:hypothetical protein
MSASAAQHCSCNWAAACAASRRHVVLLLVQQRQGGLTWCFHGPVGLHSRVGCTCRQLYVRAWCGG